jgi:hypothetical protein
LFWIAATLLSRTAATLTAGMKTSDNLLFFLPQQLMLGAFILRSLINRRKKTFIWKGRNI